MVKWAIIEDEGKPTEFVHGYFDSYDEAARYARGIYNVIYTIREEEIDNG